MALKGLLNQTITVENPSGTSDKFGKDAFDAAFSCAARVERKFRLIYTATKESIPIQATIMTGPDDEIKDGAKITYGSEEYRVFTASAVPGRNGETHHYELLCQVWSN